MVKLFISTFGEKIDWIKRKQFVPIEVGVDCRSESTIHYTITDREGDSISHLNPYFGELSVMYWLWKNYHFTEGEIVGFAHFNKILDINYDEVESLLARDNVDWIVRQPIKLPKHAYNYDVKVLEEVLKTDFPLYYPVWSTLYYSSGESKDENCSNCEMFYTTVQEFREFCDSIFGVLFEVFDRIGEVDRVPYHKRYCAFLGERLLSVYLLKNGKNVQYVPTECNENIIVKILRRTYRKLGLNNNAMVAKTVGVLRNNKKRKSSYQR